MKSRLRLLFPCPFSLNATRYTLALALLLFAPLIGALLAQDTACEKTCQDKVNGPCSGSTGKDFAQCLGNCMKACTPPPPLMDPGCADRTIHGKITCTILRPDVQVKEQKFDSSIRFAPGDIVNVAADGCVQTGGSFSTWKRYVNPSGDGILTMYHGLMEIPTAYPAGSGLIRIENFMGKLQTVMGDPNVPLSDLFLHLGYEDDNYSDNGYDNHDDGTHDQCALSNIGYPAALTVTIYRGVQPEPPQSRFNFDIMPNLVVHSVVTDHGVNTDPDHLGMDHNGLLLNPSWSWQQQPANKGNSPSGDMCHDFSTRDSVLGVPSLLLSPYFADCTDQTDENNVDVASGASAFLCGAIGKHVVETGSFPGHVNWFPVTMTGHASWGDHGDFFPFGDDDYTFNFFPNSPGKNLFLAGRDALHSEFDSDETIDNFKSKPWTDLRDAVDAADQAKAALATCSTRRICTPDQKAQYQSTIHGPAKFFDGTTVLTGMFGLDGEHDLKAELHPLFALATQLDSQSDMGDEVWLMFVRNRGDEGYCSSLLWDSGLEDYIVRLRWRKGAASVQVTQRDFEGSEGTSGPNFMIVPPGSKDDAGVYAIFHLGPAESKPYIDGAVHLSWSGVANVGESGTVSGSTSAPESTGIEARVSRPAATSTSAATKGTATQATAPKSTTAQTDATKATAAPELESADEIEQTLQAAESQLTDEQRKAIANARTPAVARQAAHPLPPGKIETVSSVPLSVRTVQVHSFKAGPATAKNDRDAAGIKALCAATKNAPPGLPADICSKAAQNQTPNESPAPPPGKPPGKN